MFGRTFWGNLGGWIGWAVVTEKLLWRKSPAVRDTKRDRSIFVMTGSNEQEIQYKSIHGLLGNPDGLVYCGISQLI